MGIRDGDAFQTGLRITNMDRRHPTCRGVGCCCVGCVVLCVLVLLGVFDTPVFGWFSGGLWGVWWWWGCVGVGGGVCCSLAAARRPASFGGWFCRVCGGDLRTQERVCTTSFIVNDCQSGPRFRVGLLIVLRGSPRGRLMGVGVFVRVAFPY